MEVEHTTTPAGQDVIQAEGGEAKEMVNFTLNFKKEKYEISWPWDDKIGNLRAHITQLTGVPIPLQKLMVKGAVKDDSATLRSVGITQGAKVMLIGSTISDVMKVNLTPDQASTVVAEEETKSTEPLCEQTKHKKIIEKGLPDNVLRGVKGRNDPLPSTPLVGVLNNRGTNVRLTFKIWSQELWISSKTSTQQIPFPQIRDVTSEPIKGHEEYHIVSLQLGQTNTEHTKYYLYWVPAQYTKAIRNSVLGTFD
ncbi:uncharacterized protein ACA1_091880 [Acanthamoeba castellanii str. Neff]|uniref:Ubiquitin-like domain-containing protein n=1 Tax=Acanthamoeba castellanii (strain ATCC 30010 / Neff) TaxID=1257118 RepID=L8GIV5_ACACF|nr:uncharacterized protein ACA1_091880 [Acanthamoeba castellanii str. Neff]ELR12678.1 hypothetical protein ACA1_091880 [Acanthamoeba castellanii str. Neff]